MVLKQKFREFGGCTLFFLLLVILATINLNGVPPVWWDEGWNFSIAYNWVDKGYYGRYLVDAPIPISPTNGFPVVALVALGFKFFDAGIWQGRILFAVVGLATIALLYHLVGRLYGRAIASGTLLVLTLMSPYAGLHPIVAGRQALGDVPAMFFLLLGYVFFLAAENKSLWLIPALACWAIALITKLQVLPFWGTSLLVPLTLLLYKRNWRLAGPVAIALVGALLTSHWLLWLIDSILQTSTLPTPQLAGLYHVTALVTSLPSRLFALIATFEFGLPTLIGLFYAVSRYFKGGIQIVPTTHTEVVSLALLVLACSWFAWYTFFSVGWVRYLYPATFVGSMFIAAMIYDLSNGFKFGSRLREIVLAAISPTHTGKKMIGTVLVGVLVGITVPRTLYMFYETYVLNADASVQKVAHFINTQTPPQALIETYDSELFFLLHRPYHYPPDQLHVDLVRRTFLYDGNVSIDYDPLHANPDYLIVGPHSKQWRLYDPVIKSGAFRLRGAYNRYEIHERVR